MKSAKPPAAETPSHRRSQPVRQTRTNPPRSSANAARAGGARDSLAGGPLGDQPIDIFPAITHFADTITALPKELVRHFTLLKEVDAKIFAPEEQLFKLVAAARSLPVPEPRTNNDASSTTAPGSAPMSAQGSSSGIMFNQRLNTAPPTDEPNRAVFDPSNLHRRQLFRQTAFKIQEMLVSLEEKNHVISTANEALQRQLARVEDVWPYLESEFSDEAKWGSTTHWAYPENRNGKSSQAERSRRDGAAAISAAAQVLVDQVAVASRSDARKQAVQAKKGQKNQSHDSDADDHEGRNKDGNKKSQPSKVRKTTESNNVGLGISTATPTNGNPPQKRRKVEKEKITNGAAPPMERAMSAVFGNSLSKPKPTSPRETPVPEVPKKRKALPTSSGQSKKKNGASAVMSPSTTSSPVLEALPEVKAHSRPSPVPGIAPPRPTSSRARRNSLQSNSENGKIRPPSSTTASKPNGNTPSTPDLGQLSSWPRPNNDTKPAKESAPVVVKTEPAQKEAVRTDNGSAVTATATATAAVTATAPAVATATAVAAPAPASAAIPTSSINCGRRESKADETDRKSEPAQPLPQPSTATITTKSGRASKPSTPALPPFQEVSRSRTTRNGDPNSSNGNGNGKKTQQKKGISAAQALLPRLADEDGASSMQGDDDDEDGDIDADEPTYCYCNSVSYGEMVACDSDDCAREWFHLACVGLKVAPSSKTKWYCEDCKERPKTGGKKVNNR